MVEQIFEKADADGSGELDFSEWQVATINKRSVLQNDKLEGAFKLFDKVPYYFCNLFSLQDGSGAISAQEIKAILGGGKKFGNDKIWDEIIKEVDVDGDGVISFEEFKLMMEKFLNVDIKK